MNFKTMQQSDVPQGRNGKRREIVTQIVSDLDQVEEGVALPKGSAGAVGGEQGKGSVCPQSRRLYRCRCDLLVRVE